MNNPKTILIGLDGASFPLVHKWIEKGLLPNFAKIKNSGSYAKLLATIPCVSASSLTALITGQNSGKTGVFDFSKLDGSVYSFTDLKQRTVWDILGDLGKKVAIIGVENTFPPKPVSGIMIGGFPLLSDDEEYTYPKELKKEVKGFHLSPEEYKDLMAAWDVKDFGRIYQIVFEQLERQEKIFFEQMDKDVFDFSIFWLAASDTIQHYCWESEGHVVKIFQRIDELLGKILDKFPEADLVVISDHGFEVMPHSRININKMFMEEGYLHLRGNWVKRQLILLSNIYAENKLANWLRSKYLRLRRRRMRRLDMPSHIKRQVLSRPMIPGLDTKKTTAYLAQRWGVNLMRENLGEKYEEVREEIVRKLENMKDQEGHPLFKLVKKREDLYSGPYTGQIPDIIVVSSTGYIPSKFLHTKLFTKIKGKRKFAAYHEMAIDGIFFGIGPSLNKAGSVEEFSMLRIAPTLLALHGVRAPVEMDGKVLENLVKNTASLSKVTTSSSSSGGDGLIEGLDI